jgi:hypothetical protein
VAVAVQVLLVQVGQALQAVLVVQVRLPQLLVLL